MRMLRPSTENEMIAEFLRQEYASFDRYGLTISAALAGEGLEDSIITNADIENADQNEARLRLFGRYRGYGQLRDSFFTDFPAGRVQWAWVELSQDELMATQFVRYWADIWAGSRQPRELAQQILHGDIPVWADEQDAVRVHVERAQRIREGLRLPPLIMVSADGGQTRVAMEGNSRLTSYGLAYPDGPARLPVLLGCSPDIARWDEY